MKCLSFGKFRFRNPSQPFEHLDRAYPRSGTTDVCGQPRNYSARRIRRTVVEGTRSLSSYDGRVTALKSYPLPDRCRVPRVMTPKRALRPLTDVHATDGWS